MQIPGGVLAQRYGTKTVFGISNGVAAILSFAVPASAKFSYKALVFVRIIQGFISVRLSFLKLTLHIFSLLFLLGCCVAFNAYNDR